MSPDLLMLLGAVIGLGFLGNLFLEKTRTPDVLLLMTVGLLVGPVLHLVSAEAFRPFAPALGTIALT